MSSDTQVTQENQQTLYRDWLVIYDNKVVKRIFPLIMTILDWIGSLDCSTEDSDLVFRGLSFGFQHSHQAAHNWF